MRELLRVSAAIQKQIVRDVSPIWGVTATVDPFERLEDVPIGYWPVILTLRDMGGQDGTHLDDDGAPYALVEACGQWSIAASHECIELLVDPFGNRTVAGRSPRAGVLDAARVEVLVEPCDPCQSAASAYTVNDVAVSDFVTPDYFGPLVTSTARRSYSGRITKPLELLAGGCLSWMESESKMWWQRECDEKGAIHDAQLGVIDARVRGHRSLREVVNATTQHHHRIARSATPQMVDAVKRLAAHGRRAAATRGRALRVHMQALPARAPKDAPRAVDDEIKSALAILSARADLPDRDRVQSTLERALAQLGEAKAQGSARALDGAEEYELAIVRSSIAEPLVAPQRSVLTARAVTGFAQYADLDVRWLATAWNHVVRPLVPFPIAPPGAVNHPLQRTCTIAIAGDWGTGNASSRAIGAAIDAQQPTYTIHLGDVYYSGTESEETRNLLPLWPRGQLASFTLNSNHEMYSGGHGYFGVALTSDTFEAQGPYSYFVLVNDDWAIIGLDSAYVATSFYQNGALNDPQIAWLKALEANGTFVNAAGKRKKLLLLTHHLGLDLAGNKVEPLWSQVMGALKSPPDVWYWGHDHGVAVYKPVQASGGEVRARLIGHGGIPYIADPATSATLWTETEAAGDPALPKRSLNGFALLRIDGALLIEELWDEKGRKRWSSA